MQILPAKFCRVWEAPALVGLDPSTGARTSLASRRPLALIDGIWPKEQTLKAIGEQRGISSFVRTYANTAVAF
jgi:hypothetical protein